MKIILRVIIGLIIMAFAIAMIVLLVTYMPSRETFNIIGHILLGLLAIGAILTGAHEIGKSIIK